LFNSKHLEDRSGSTNPLLACHFIFACFAHALFSQRRNDYGGAATGGGQKQEMPATAFLTKHI
jgi:hypothetical protein